jgi:hypothetical protein
MNGIFSKQDMKNLKLKEAIKKELLDCEEEKWRHKSITTWIAQVDENTSFFHNYAKMRKNINTI